MPIHYEGKQVVGSALLYRKKVIHMAFFRVTEGEKAGSSQGYIAGEGALGLIRAREGDDLR